MNRKENPSRAKLLSIALDNNHIDLLAHIFELPSHFKSENERNMKKSKAFDLKKAMMSASVNANSSNSLAANWQSLVQMNSELAKSEDAVQAFEVQKKLHPRFNAAFATSSGNWCVPALHVVCRNTFYLASLSDGETKETNKEMAVTLLQESFSRTINDRTKYNPKESLSTTGSKKCGVLLIVNLLFRIYFKLNKLRLCKNLLKAVEVQSLHKSSDMTQRIVFNYYVGRLYLFEDNFDRAEECLDFCLRKERDSANRKRILNFLVPVRLLKGKLPSQQLLETYAMHPYMSLIDGLMVGNLEQFSRALDKNSELFLKRGVFLLLEKCKFIAYRNLFKRCWLILEKSSQISLAQLLKAFKFCGKQVDLDEIECVLANLIYKGYIKGYLSHTKRMLVLSKRDPFPTGAVISK